MKPANFNVVYQGVSDLSKLYKQLKLGKFDPNNFDPNKVIDDIITVNLEMLNAFTGSDEDRTLTKEYITVDGIKSLKVTNHSTVPDLTGEGETRMCQCMVLTYVPKLNALYQFTFSDDEEDYLKSSEIFNSVIRSIRFLP